jgi:hypothetical protein
MPEPETKKDVEKYISGSKVNIDNYIRKKEYRKAFGLLILFLNLLTFQSPIYIS